MNKFFAKYIAPYFKAHLGGFTSAFGFILADTQGNLGNIGHLTGTQWTDLVLVALGVYAAVGGSTNTPYVAPVAPALPSQDVAA